MTPLVYRFGVFELNGSTGELRKDGLVEPRLRDQSLRVLLTLLERPREVVTREELRQRLWASDTFVDFDHGLNAAVNQLRTALGDSASSPRFIQTLPRKGYRFIAPVEVANSAIEIVGSTREKNQLAPSSVPSPPMEDATASASTDAIVRSILSDARDLPQVNSETVRVLFGLLQIMYLIFYVFSLAKLTEIERILAAVGKPAHLVWIALVITAAAGIPLRLYLLAAVGFRYRGLAGKFLKLFALIFPVDELWALAPFLLAEKIGIGLAIAATAALLYLPFAQRSLLLMGSSSQK